MTICLALFTEVQFFFGFRQFAFRPFGFLLVFPEFEAEALIDFAFLLHRFVEFTRKRVGKHRLFVEAKARQAFIFFKGGREVFQKA